MSGVYRPIDVTAAEAAMPRLLARGIRNDNGCLLWQGAILQCGYGQTRIGGRYVYVHRATWVAVHGRDPGKLEIDHLCRIRECFAIEHLEAVTPSVNSQRRYSRAHGDACFRGHPWDEANTYYYRNRRFCRACGRIRDKKRPPRQAAA